MIGTMYRPSYYLYLLAALVIGLLALYLYADTIAITAPPWDYCGFHATHAGRALDCIRFDVDLINLK